MTGASKVVLEILENTDMLNKAPPRSIICNDAQGPYSHFAFPINGVEATSTKGSGTQGQKIVVRRTTKSTPTAVTAIQVKPKEASRVEGNSKSLPDDVASRPEKEPEKPRPILTETVVALPPVAKPKSEVSSPKESLNEQESSERIKSFLKQIPDLSFMLAPQLSLPNGNGST